MFNEINVVALFFEEPTREFNVREYARLQKISPATASKRLKKLAKQGFLSFRKERIIDLYKANMESTSYTDLKLYYNIRKMRESGIIEAINEFYLKPAVVFFGSGSEGLDTEDSDFDLLIISEKKSELSKLRIYEKKLNRRVQLLVHKSIKEVRNHHLLSNIHKGIVIQGEVKWT